MARLQVGTDTRSTRRILHSFLALVFTQLCHFPNEGCQFQLQLSAISANSCAHHQEEKTAENMKNMNIKPIFGKLNLLQSRGPQLT